MLRRRADRSLRLSARSISPRPATWPWPCAISATTRGNAPAHARGDADHALAVHHHGPAFHRLAAGRPEFMRLVYRQLQPTASAASCCSIRCTKCRP
jgi:hypothetical protein